MSCAVSPSCSGELSIQVAVEMPFDIKSVESPTHKIKLKVSESPSLPLSLSPSLPFSSLTLAHFLCICHSHFQKTATMATVELCPGSSLGAGFQLHIALAEIHVPRMWVEEDKNGHHVRRGMGRREEGGGRG